MTSYLFGVSPGDVYSFLSALPGAGTLESLILAVNALSGSSFDTDPFSEIASSAISYTSSFGLPTGWVSVSINDAISGYDSAHGELYTKTSITAVRTSVPDAGSTALFAFAGLGILFAAKKRIRR